MNIRGLSVIVVVAAVAVGTVVPTGVVGQAPPRLVQPSTLVKLGTITMPADSGGRGFEWGGTALAYNTANDSLFIVGHDWDQLIAEVTIPPLGGTASILQPLQDPAEGRSVGESDAKVGGALVHGGRLWFTKYIYYDAEAAQTASHFNRPLDLATTGQVVGPQTIGPLAAGFVSGYLGRIPAEWQARLGDTVLTGNCCLSILEPHVVRPCRVGMDAWADQVHSARLLHHRPSDVGDLRSARQPSAVQRDHPHQGDRLSGRHRQRLVLRADGHRAVPVTATRTSVATRPTPIEASTPIRTVCTSGPTTRTIWRPHAPARSSPGRSSPMRCGTSGSMAPASSAATRRTDPATGRIFVSEVTGNGDLPLIHVFTAGLAQPAPTVTAVTPSTGTTAGGTVVTIAGTNLTTGATVTLGGLAARSVTVVGSTSIRATTGAHPAGPVDVVVRNPDGQQATLTSGFTYAVFADPPPTVTSVSPGTGPTSGGTTVTISGFGFRTGVAVGSAGRRRRGSP